MSDEKLKNTEHADLSENSENIGINENNTEEPEVNPNPCEDDPDNLDNLESEVSDIQETTEETPAAVTENFSGQLDETQEKNDADSSNGDELKKITESLLRIEALQEKNNMELSNMHKNYHNGFDDIIRKQQKEIDKFREGLIDSKFDFILGEIARIHGDYSGGESDDFDKLKKRYFYILDELLQFLHENKVEDYKTEIGQKYSPRYCKVIGKEFTGEIEKNGVVIESRNTGFFRDKIVLVPERVKIYVYDEKLKPVENEEV